MSEQEHIRTVREAYSSFKNGDIEGLLEALTDDVEWITPGPPDIMPVAGKRRGRKQVAQFFTALEELEDVQSFEVEEVIAQGDKVVAMIKYRGRVKATGKPVESDLVHVFSFDQGKVKRFREYFDTAAVLDAYRPAVKAVSASSSSSSKPSSRR